MSNKSGQSLIEYIVILVVIALACVVAMFLLRSQINTLFTRISTTMNVGPK